MAKTLETFPDTKAFLEREWRKWLSARHGDHVPIALGAELKGKSLDAAPLPPLYDRKSELANEFALFRMHISADCAKWCAAVVRAAGYDGLITQYNASKNLGESAVRWQVSEVVDMHSYYRHPIGGWGAVGTRVEQSSSLADAAGYWRYANSTRLSDAPLSSANSITASGTPTSMKGDSSSALTPPSKASVPWRFTPAPYRST